MMLQSLIYNYIDLPILKLKLKIYYANRILVSVGTINLDILNFLTQAANNCVNCI